MPCVGYEMLERYATGAALPPERAEVESHAASCEACRLTLAAVGLAFEPGSPEEEALVAWMASSRPVDALLEELFRKDASSGSAGRLVAVGGTHREAAASEAPAGTRERQRHGAPTRARRRFPVLPWRAAAGGLAAAAALAAGFALLPGDAADPAWMTDLAPAYRATEARPSAPVRYAPFEPVRGEENRARFEASLHEVLSARSSEPEAAPNFLAALYLWRGEVGDHERALEELGKIPYSPRRENDRGALLLARGDTEGALRAIDRALAAEPDFGPALFNRGLVLEALGREADAASAWRAYLERTHEAPEWRAEAQVHLERLAK